MYTFDTRVSYSRTDKKGNVPLFEIMNYLQDCTTFHSEEIVVGVEYMKSIRKAWVLISYKIKIIRPIAMGEKIRVGTAPTEFGKLFASRKILIQTIEGEDLVKADTIWVVMDLDSRKPEKITREICSGYDDYL